MDDVVEVDAPGSLAPLTLFHRWCRCFTELAVMHSPRPPRLIFTDGRDFDEPQHEQWTVTGEVPTTDELLRRLIPAQATRTGASQVGVCVPIGDPAPIVLVIAVDETGALAEHADVHQLGDSFHVDEWAPASLDELPITVWQQLLALNAGYHRFAKWRCIGCGSVCPGEADERPGPCDFCGRKDVEAVPIETPLEPPRLADSETADETTGSSNVAKQLGRSPFNALLGVVRRRGRG
jgi:hypothetical protein